MSCLIFALVPTRMDIQVACLPLREELGQEAYLLMMLAHAVLGDSGSFSQSLTEEIEDVDSHTHTYVFIS